MRQWPKNRYVVGDQKDTCARCGFDYLNSELVEEERTGLMVCSHCYDPIHPQDNRPYSTASSTKRGTIGSTNTSTPGTVSPGPTGNDSAYVDSP